MTAAPSMPSATGMTVVAVIPARGGSVGVPRKNLRLVGGVPLVGRTIAAALCAQTIDEVFVSTDDDEIARVASRFGAVIIRRPEYLAGHTASSESALLHALDVLQASGVSPTHLVMLQCTSPFTTGADIDRVTGALLSGAAHAAFAVVPDHGFLWRIGAKGYAQGINHDHTGARERRQDREPQYRETGAIYAMQVAAFRETGRRFCGDTLAVPVSGPPLEIDDETDFCMAEALASMESRVRAVTSAALGGPVDGQRREAEGLDAGRTIAAQEQRW